MLADGFFVSLEDLDAVEHAGCRVYAPPMSCPVSARRRDTPAARSISRWLALTDNAALRAITLRAQAAT